MVLNAILFIVGLLAFLVFVLWGAGHWNEKRKQRQKGYDVNTDMWKRS